MQLSQNIAYRNAQFNNVRTNNKINNNNNNRINNTASTDTVSFTGLNKLDPRNLSRVGEYVEYMISHSAPILGVDGEKVQGALKKYSNPQKRIYARLVDTYNGTNFYADKKEDPNLIFRLLDNLRFPTQSHSDLVNNRHLKVSDIARSMENLGYDSRKVGKFNEVTNSLRNFAEETSSIVDITESPNADEYITHFDRYSAYFKRHANEKDYVKTLDEQIANGTYNRVKEEKYFNLEQACAHVGSRDFVNTDELHPYTSDAANLIMEVIFDKLNPRLLKDSKNFRENFAQIYKTTNKNNVDARVDYLVGYKYSTGVHEFAKDEMDNITKLFARMDEDKSAMKFIRKVITPESNGNGAGAYLRLIENISPEKREIYLPNIKKIMAISDKDSADKAIKFCALQPEALSTRVKRSVKGFFTGLFSKEKNVEAKENREGRRIFRRTYNPIQVAESEKPEAININEAFGAKKTAETKVDIPAEVPAKPVQEQKPVQPLVLPKIEDIIGEKNRFKFNIPAPVVASEPKATPNLPAPIYQFPVIEQFKNAANGVTAPVIKAEKPIKAKKVLSAEEIQQQQELSDKLLQKGILVNRSKKMPSVKKLTVISDTNDVIERKLGKATYNDQKNGFAAKATKMRLSLLPEIFASIKETRADKRAKGLFDAKLAEKNADALELFTMINGKNKKLVNYMLKARKEDGTRAFSVKEIIYKLKVVEENIETAKKVSTLEKPFTNKDAKVIYDDLFQEYVKVFGKLKRSNSKNQSK